MHNPIWTATFWLAGVAAAWALDASGIYLASVPRPMPDGESFVFVWCGDLWRAPVAGGDAVQLTRHPAEDHWPAVSPDGREIAFASKRDDAWQVYVMPAEGGEPVALTRHSEGCVPLCWFPDGQSILARGLRDQAGQNAVRFLRIARDGRTPERVLFDDYGLEADVAPDGRRVLFTREGEDLYRRGYRGSKAGQVWLYDLAAGTFTLLLGGGREHRTPLWRPDGKGFYVVVQAGDCANLCSVDLATLQPEPLTRYADAPVVLPGLARNGRVCVFRQGFDFYRLDPRKGRDPERIALRPPPDMPRETERRRWYAQVWNNDGEGSLDWTENGQQMCFTAGGDVWAMDTVVCEPRAVTSGTADHDREAVFAPDGRAILFLRDTGDAVNVWRARCAETNRPWWQNTRFELAPLTRDTLGRYALSVSPTGSNVAWCVERGDVMVADPAGSNAVRVARSAFDAWYDWSPDGRWLACDLADSDGNRDIWIVPADGRGSPYNLSRHPGDDYCPRWSPDGRMIAFVGTRFNDGADLFYAYLREADDAETARDRSLERAAKKPAEEGKDAAARGGDGRSNGTARVAIDFERLYERVRRIDVDGEAPRDPFWSFDSKALAFHAAVGGRRGTYKVVLPEPAKPEFMTEKTGTQGQWIRKDSRILWLMDRVPAHYTTAFPFKAHQTTRLAEYRRLALRTIWRIMRDRFYDAGVNGRDWPAMLATYEDAAACAPDRDVFDRTVAMLLGELNASHTGFRETDEAKREWGTDWKSRNWSVRTGHTGLRFDPAWGGPGLRVRDVIPDGPTDRPQSRIWPGELVLAIGDRPVSPTNDLAEALTGLYPRDERLRVRDTNGVERTVTVRTIAFEAARDLLRAEEIRTARRRVDAHSGGALGYLHVERMQWDDLRKFEREVFACGVGKDGLVIDVRGNTGGFIADRLLSMLCPPDHAVTVPRGGGPGYPLGYLGRAVWTKPIVVLCNQNTVSNGEIFCHAIKSLRRGRVVGVPTQGGVIATPERAVLDLGTLRVPERGWFVRATGQDMELNGCEPDEVIWPQPGEAAAGIDRQLDRAVEVLQEDIRAALSQPSAPLVRARERRGAGQP